MQVSFTLGLSKWEQEGSFYSFVVFVVCVCLWKMFYLHALGGHAGRLVKNLKLVPARSEGVVADEVLQGRLLQPAGAERGAAVRVLQDGVATWCTLWRERCKYSQRDNIKTGSSPRLSVPVIEYLQGLLQAKQFVVDIHVPAWSQNQHFPMSYIGPLTWSVLSSSKTNSVIEMFMMKTWAVGKR